MYLADFYKDTNYVYCFYDMTNQPDIYKYLPKTKKVYEISITWETFFERTDSAMFYIFDAEVIENTSLDSVRDNYMILERIDFTYDDLINWDWEITYPTEEL